MYGDWMWAKRNWPYYCFNSNRPIKHLYMNHLSSASHFLIDRGKMFPESKLRKQQGMLIISWIFNF